LILVQIDFEIDSNRIGAKPQRSDSIEQRSILLLESAAFVENLRTGSRHFAGAV